MTTIPQFLATGCNKLYFIGTVDVDAHRFECSLFDTISTLVEAFGLTVFISLSSLNHSPIQIPKVDFLLSSLAKQAKKSFIVLDVIS